MRLYRHTFTSAWLPILAVAVLIAGFAVLLLTARPGERIPPLPPGIEFETRGGQR